VMVDGEGALYDGDQLLYIIAKERARSGRVAGVAGTLMTNLALENALGKLGIPFARASVGDRYVLEMLQKNRWQLGGENSGHIICLDKHTTGDGIVSALQVLSALRTRRSTLDAYTRELKLYPQVLLNVRVQRGYDWQKKPVVLKAKQAAEKTLGRNGRVLLRASGTEPVLRVMVEGKDQTKVRTLAQTLAAAVESAR
jgi:phosphoglucosamine mutase